MRNMKTSVNAGAHSSRSPCTGRGSSGLGAEGPSHRHGRRRTVACISPSASDAYRPVALDGGASTRRISASAARPTSSCASDGSRVPSRRCSSCPAGAARARRRCRRGARSRRRPRRRCPSDATPTAICAAGPGRLERAAQQRGAGEVRRQQRRHEVRAAAVVLLRGVGGVGGVGLVGGDRLVLDAVVLGELAAAQRDEARQQRDRRDDRLGADAGLHRAAQERARRPPRRPSSPSTLTSWNGQLGLRQRALDERDDEHRLAEAHDPAHAGDACRRP